ncbi:unnamed protein product [Malus baccata var. baccata]
MISTGRFPPSCTSKSLLAAAISFPPHKSQLGFAVFPLPSTSSSLPTAIFKTSFFLPPIRQTHRAHLGFLAVQARRSSGSGVSSQKRQRRGGVVTDDDSDDDEELELDGSDDVFDGEEEDDDEDAFVPFGKMKKWLERKPRGFGEGKEYDISIEEKLLEEIEKSKKAQAESNLAKLSEKPNLKGDQSKNSSKSVGAAPDGVRVRLINLPKKKNIHRDLSSAFKLVPGLISINPAVSGNKKTKDPICKGFAFVHFKSEIDATRFVEMFSSQNVTFGKIQKQIKCELVDTPQPNLDQKQSTNNHSALPLIVSGLEGDYKADFDSDDSSMDSLEETTLDEYEGSDVEIVGPELEDVMEHSSDNHTARELNVSELEDEKADSDLDDSSQETWEETIVDEYDGSDFELNESELEDAIENLESISGSDLDGGDRDSMKSRTESESLSADSSSSKQLLVKAKEEKLPRQKPAMKGKDESSPENKKKKKLNVKQKAVKVPKLTVGGSAKRLKVKEKAVLASWPSQKPISFSLCFASGPVASLFSETCTIHRPLVTVMNCLSQVSSCTTAIFRTKSCFVAAASSYLCTPLPWRTKFNRPIGIKSINLESTRLHVQLYSSRSSSSKTTALRSRRKSEPEPVTEPEKDAFYVVRKGDIVGVYKSFSDCQAQLGSSIFDPPVSVYKGYSLTEETEDYLVSFGLKNAIYTIRAEDLKDDLFGKLLHCPFQDPTSSKDETSALDASEKRPREVPGSENVEVIGSTSILEDQFRKHVEIEHFTESPPLDTESCILEFDGASKGNPGLAGAGAVLRADDGSLICKIHEGLGVRTNNVAEYRALILGLKYALKKGFTKIRIKGDSKLVCMQVQGLWKVRNQNMSDLCEEVKELKDKFISFQISHVLRVGEVGSVYILWVTGCTC